MSNNLAMHTVGVPHSGSYIPGSRGLSSYNSTNVPGYPFISEHPLLTYAIPHERVGDPLDIDSYLLTSNDVPPPDDDDDCSFGQGLQGPWTGTNERSPHCNQVQSRYDYETVTIPCNLTILPTSVIRNLGYSNINDLSLTY